MDNYKCRFLDSAVFEAKQFDGTKSIENWSVSSAKVSPVLQPTEDNPSGSYFQIETPTGPQTGSVGDWLVCNEAGDYSISTDEAFKNIFVPLKSNRDSEASETAKLATTGFDKLHQCKLILKEMEKHKITREHLRLAAGDYGRYAQSRSTYWACAWAHAEALMK